jgi:protocatechuate 3,4-dioxygenase beta subunit
MNTLKTRGAQRRKENNPMTAKNENKPTISRRRFVQSSAVAAVGALLAACRAGSPPAEITPAQPAAQIPPTVTPEPAPANTPLPTATDTLPPTTVPPLEPTPQCADHDETPAQTAGPFYTPDTPLRTSFLEAGITGDTLMVSGRVLTPNCRPVAGAVLDFWHADDHGQYDNVGYRLRGHQFTNADGYYRLETIVPGLYPGRTRHIHVIVQGPTTRQLTTQLYFPDEPGNQTDGIFHPALVMAVKNADDGQTAAFDFVLT